MSDSEAELDLLDEEIDDEDAFHVGEGLESPKANMYTTRDLHDLIHQGYIDLTPPYQRDIVWTPDKQSKLLDSIYRNFYVPPILFAVFNDTDGNEVKKCVDGKQRLTSIQAFIDGLIPYKDPKTRKQFWWNQSGKSNRREVPRAWKEAFQEKELTCVEYHMLTDAQERDVFQRVQLGMSLTVAERLQAVSSKRADWINSLDRYLSAEDGLMYHIDVDLRRGRNFQLLAQVAYYCHCIPEQVFPSLNKLEAWVADTQELSPEFKKQVEDVMSRFWAIANQESKLNHGFRDIPQRVAPAEFIFIGIILNVLRRCRSADIAEEVHNMRLYIRKLYPDVRHRADIVKSLWEFVTSISEKYDEVDIKWAVPEPKSKGSKRRKKERDDNHYDSDDEVNTSARGKAKARKKA